MTEKQRPIEEISAEEIEVVGSSSSREKVTRISVDEPYGGAEGNPFEQIMKLAAEWKKVRFFGILALFLSLIGIGFAPFYFSSAALVLGLLDLWKGSRLTRKLAIAAIVLAVLALLNAWT